MTDPLARDATGQAEAIGRREVAARELIEAAIARIEAVDGAYNAVVTPLFEDALVAAERAEGQWRGVPMLVKDLLARVGGARQTEGSRALAGQVAADDSELVARYRAAGLTILGKTNTSEFGATPVTEGELFGPARNPWDVTRTAGGSSGGSAVAVASGMVAVAHGNDGGGSLRIPASCCGVFGFKPSRGRNPLGPEYADLHARIICEHVITRSVRDSARLLDATAGALPGAPYVAPPPPRPFAEELRGEPRRLRIAASWRPILDVEVEPEVRAAHEQTARLCEQLGHEVVEAQPELDEAELMEAWFALWAEGNAWMVDEATRIAGEPPSAERFEPMTWRYYTRAHEDTAIRHQRLLQAINRGAQALGRFLEGFDAWLTPTLAQPPLELGDFYDVEDTIQRYLRFAPYTRLANLAGLPAMSVPLHASARGLPIGSHFAASFGDESTLFALAGQLEQARPWAGRRPPEPAKEEARARSH